jgi:AmiR/NasT family two-component response regulator
MHDLVASDGGGTGWRGNRAPVTGRIDEKDELQGEIVNLRRALETRTTIGIAIGILMSQEGVSRTEAFCLLRRISQVHNIKLRDVALKVVEDHESDCATDTEG